MTHDVAHPRFTRLQLTDFRNYATLDQAFSASMIALVGENGAGKTNLLEALSFFTPGRGLRRADLDEPARLDGTGGWAVSAVLRTDMGDVRLGTGTELDEPGRRCRIDRHAVGSAAAFANHLRMVWLTPAQDGLFTGPAGDRRRFMDRLVLAVDPSHGARVTALDKALRQRNRLLEDERYDPAWASAIEREIAETGIAVAAARYETVSRLAALIERHRDEASLFPHAAIMLDGEIERRVGSEPAGEIEDWFRERLRETRARDRAAGRTLTGPQTCDLKVWHGPKSMPADRASTGEQKALLIGLVLAHARLVTEMSGIAPVILMDEVAAHLDPGRRAALYETLALLDGQVWMTGTDAALFDGLGADSLMLTINNGAIRERSHG
ncbi:MAG: DNA replication/repair protein RecF [Beijerinckiaceae bacterium]|nr:DNA replication/repair protein RecF [Beijerinckiaceae bacterium]